jgi:hypothetical protein
MSKRVALIVVPLSLAAIVIAPLWLDQPFRTQTSRMLAGVYHLRRWSPVLALVGAAVVTMLAVVGWREVRRPLARVAIVAAWAVAVGAAWVARQNPFEWKFNPLPRPGFVAARDAGFVEPNDLVLAVTIEGESVAYPIRQLAYHHVVNDVVGGVPLAATY